MKLCLCNEILQDFPLERQFETAAELGFAALEIAPFTLHRNVCQIPTATRTRLRELAAATGVEIAGLHWLLAQTDGYHLTSPDAGVRARTVAYLEDLVRFGVEIGGRIAVLGSPLQRSLLPGVSYAQAWEWFAEGVATAAAVPGGEQFTLCIEPLAPKTQNTFLFTAAEAVRMARKIGRPNVKITVDFYSAVDMEIDVPATLRAVGDYLGHVHLNDHNGRAPGYGETDFGPLMQTLVEMGYEGYASIEVFDFSLDPVEHARRGLETVREALG
ncbi:MAG TPA: sugar phosphate isomerase/epimerase family protein [Armatimonadota bacterium]|jgi:sugar phosphate isomerase/epimerase